MIGIDHSKAPLKYRETFSFTKAMAQRAAVSLKEGYALSGCVLISTCNRTELWICEDEELVPKELWLGDKLPDMLCSMKGANKEEYLPYFTERTGDEAVNHIFRLACGLDSRIFGEDQIISQVRDALELGRDAGTMGPELDRLFQMAITAGKRVKTEVRLTNVNQSSATSIIEKLKEDGINLRGLNCLVIGNGKMGKLVANALVSSGAKVSMTLRRKMHKNDEQNSIMPQGCNMLSYDDRMEEVPKNQVVVSATLSPHYTITKRAFVDGKKANRDLALFYENKNGEKKQYLFDLAVPRDIQESIACEEDVCLFDIDSLIMDGANSQNAEALTVAEEILAGYERDFAEWLEFRKNLKPLNFIMESIKKDVNARLCSVSKLKTDVRFAAGAAVAGYATEKAAKKFMFEALKELNEEQRQACIEALEKAAARESKRH